MKKIFMYIHSLHRGAGAENVMFQLCTLLQKHKYQVVVCGMVDEYPSFESEYQILNIPVYRLSMQKSIFNKIFKLIKLFKILSKEKPDIFMAWLRPAILTGGLISKLARVKIRIANLRGPALNKTKLKVLLDRIFARNYTNYIAVSESVKRIFSNREKFPDNKIAVINNGIATNVKIRKSKNNKVFTFGTIGRLYPEKNQDLLLKTAQLLKKKKFKFKLVLVGDGPSENDLKAQTKKLGLAKDVIFKGWQKDIYAELAAMDVFVLPSKYEGHPSAILQAWLMQKPVLATKVSGIADIVVDGFNGYLFNKNEPQELANLLINLNKQPQFGDKIAKHGRETVLRDYSIEKMNKKYLQFLSACTAGTVTRL